MNRFSRSIFRIQLAAGTGCISVFFVVVVIQVFCRYAGITVTWTGEVSTYTFIWAVFMGAGAMTHENAHFAFTALEDRLSGPKRIRLRIVISCAVMIFTAATLYFGIVITRKFWNYRWIYLPDVKKGYALLCLPVFGFTGTLYSITQVYNSLHELKSA